MAKPKKMLGDYLKQAHISFVLDSKLTQKVAKEFLEDLISIVGLKIVFLKINPLPPGFDIVGGLKESCVYLGYWAEVNFVSIYLSSCKNFDATKIYEVVTNRFDTVGGVEVSIIKDIPVKEEVERLIWEVR